MNEKETDKRAEIFVHRSQHESPDDNSRFHFFPGKILCKYLKMLSKVSRDSRRFSQNDLFTDLKLNSINDASKKTNLNFNSLLIDGIMSVEKFHMRRADTHRHARTQIINETAVLESRGLMSQPKRMIITRPICRQFVRQFEQAMQKG